MRGANPFVPDQFGQATRRGAPACNRRRRELGDQRPSEHQVDRLTCRTLTIPIEQRLGQRVEAVADRPSAGAPSPVPARPMPDAASAARLAAKASYFARVAAHDDRPRPASRALRRRQPRRRSRPSARRRGTARPSLPAGAAPSPKIGSSRRTSPPRLPGSTVISSIVRSDTVRGTKARAVALLGAAFDDRVADIGAGSPTRSK